MGTAYLHFVFAQEVFFLGVGHYDSSYFYENWLKIMKNFNLKNAGGGLLADHSYLVLISLS